MTRTASEIGLLLAASAVTGAALAIALADPAGWARLGREDGPVEVAGVAAFLILALVAARRFARGPRGARAPSVIAFLVGLMGAGEEISWGQRLLGLEPPAFFRAYNSQGEINLHNLLPPPWDALLGALLVLGFCCAPLARDTAAVRALAHNGLPWPRPLHVAVLAGCLAAGLAVAVTTHARELEEVGELVFVLIVAATWAAPAPPGSDGGGDP